MLFPGQDVEIDKRGDANDGRAGKVAHKKYDHANGTTYIVDFHGEGVGEYAEQQLRPLPMVPIARVPFP